MKCGDQHACRKLFMWLSQFFDGRMCVQTATPEPAGEEKEKFFDPVTGEQISKNAYKKLLKGAPAKKDKPAKAAPAAAEGEEKAKKEKKEKVAKEPEAIFVDQTPAGQKVRE